MTNMLILFIGAFIIAISSCKKKSPVPTSVINDQLMVTVRPTFGTSDLNLDETVITNEGYAIQFTDVRFYVTSLKNTSGKQLVEAALFDYRNNGIELLKVEGKPSDFPSIFGYLGVESSLNHSDPASFTSANPLSTSIANDMHWDWNPGYIFVRIEAKVDTLTDGVENFNHNVLFHIGGDNLLQNLNFSSLNWTSSGQGVYTMGLKLDLQKFLQNGTSKIDVKSEHKSHSLKAEEALSLKVIQNFRDALSPF
jgi:hypothetical protein